MQTEKLRVLSTDPRAGKKKVSSLIEDCRISAPPLESIDRPQSSCRDVGGDERVAAAGEGVRDVARPRAVRGAALPGQLKDQDQEAGEERHWN